MSLDKIDSSRSGFSNANNSRIEIDGVPSDTYLEQEGVDHRDLGSSGKSIAVGFNFSGFESSVKSRCGTFGHLP